MKNDEMHSKALELEHMTFENERLQADLAKMEKVSFFWKLSNTTSEFRKTFFHSNDLLVFFRYLKKNRKKQKTFIFIPKSHRKSWENVYHRKRYMKKFPNVVYSAVVHVVMSIRSYSGHSCRIA